MNIKGRQRCARAISLVFVAATLALWPTSAAFAAETMALSKTVDDNVLVGDPVSVTLTATNSGDVADYNLSFRDVLPAGVTYKPGSTSPASLGEPQIITTGNPAVQTLIWDNVSDLPPGGVQSLTFKVDLDPVAHPVGSEVDNSAQAYANSDPRTVPKFDSSGELTSGSTVTGTSGTATTSVSAIKVVKAEPSPEGELPRGIHDNTTTYTLTVTNNSLFDNDNVILVDYLPAGLEFLGCGTEDNGPLEYTDAPSLTLAPDVPDCTGVQIPTSVSTVDDFAGAAGVFTRVEWDLGTMTPGQTVVITYAAGIPQLANTMDFSDGLPTPASGDQGSNLDNNTGAPTRETGSELALTNYTEVAADYTGPVAPNTPTRVGDTDTETVTAEDVAMQKSVSPQLFSQGDLATYTLELQGSEYTTGADIVITDVLPDGVCPVGGPGINYAGTDPECVGTGSSAPSVPFANPPVANGDGTWTLTFDPVALPQNGALTITYQARMRSTYASDGDPTVAGDSFTNTASLTGDTTTIAEVEPPGGVTTITVKDTSSATIKSETVQLDKRIQPWTSTPYTCSTTAGDYQDAADTTLPAFTFNEDSRVCFTIRIDFPDGVDTKNPVLTDFLPDDLVYEASSATAMPGNTVSNVAFDNTDLVFTMGDEVNGNKFARKGTVFLYRLSGIVVKAPPSAPDVTGNLAKLRWTSTDGAVRFLRDREDFSVAPPPPVSVVKSANRLVATAPGTTGNLPDGGTANSQRIRSGDVVEFSVAVTNDGTSANRNDVPVVGPDVWDRLPRGITCDDVAPISDGGECTDPGDLDHPTFNTAAQQSAIRWDTADAVTIDAGETLTFTYRVTYPATISATRSYRNDVDVASYASESDRETLVQHYPASNVDNTVTPDQVDVPIAHDDHTLLTPNASVAKSNLTQTTDADQGPTPASKHYATLGETVTYTVVGTIPAATTLYNGVLYDTTPTGIRVDAVVFDYSTDNGATYGPLPGTFATSLAAPGPKVTFPAAVDAGPEADLVRMTITSTVTDLAAFDHGDTVTNTARLTATTEYGTATTTRTNSSSIELVEPVPAPLKSANPTEPTAGATVTYTVTARNLDNTQPNLIRPTLFESRLVDCVPAGLSIDSGSLSQITASVGTVGTEGCAATATPIVWEVGDLPWRSTADANGPNPWPVLTYTVTVDPGAAGGASYTNTVAQTGTSMDGDDPDERDYVGTADATITAPGGTLTKDVTPSNVPVGDIVTYTITADLPAEINFYDATIIDSLPAGIDPASVVLVSSSCAFTDVTGGACAVEATTGGALGPQGQLHGWSLGSVASATRPRAVTVTYTAVVGVVVGNIAGTALTNSATLAWNFTDQPGTPGLTDPFDEASDPDTATTTVTEPDLSISKSVDNATPTPGEPFTYTVVVTNATGSTVSAAHGITVVDTIPAGVVPVEASIDNSGVLSGSTITWTGLGPIAAGGTVTLTYQAVLATPAPTQAQTNTADITTYTSLPGGDGRVYDGPEDTATVTPALPDLEIVKTLLDGPPSYVGEATRWQMVVTNIGDATAFDVDVTDLLPDNWSYDTASARISVDGATPVAIEPTSITGTTQQTLTWVNLADLAPDATIVVVLSATPGEALNPDGIGSTIAHVNTAGTSGQDLDGDAGSVITEDEDTAQTRIDAADLQILKQAVGTPIAGSPFSWTLSVTNNGPDAAEGPFTVTDTLPAQVTGATATGTGWTCSATPGTVTCQRTDDAETLADGDSFPDITVTANVPVGLPSGTPLDNQATVAGHTPDPDDTNNTDETTTDVDTVSDFGIDKALSGAMVPGLPVTYTLAVTNAGPSVSRGPIVVTDTLPNELSFTSYTGTDWDLTRDGQELTFTWVGDYPVALGSLPQISIVASLASDATAAITNSATVTEPTDPPSGPEQPDTDTVTVTPAPEADLALSKSSTGDFNAGQQGTYLFTVENFGPSDAAGPITVTDTLADDLTYVSVSSTGDVWDCSASGQDLTCTRAAGLADEGVSTFEVTVDIDAGLSGNVVNTATVSGPTTDPNDGNDTDTDDTGIEVLADLSIVKTLTTDPVIAGENATYTLVVSNGGPSDSPGPVTVTDTLPAGLTYVDASGTGWACDATGQVVTCERAATLDAGTSAAPITLIVKVGSDVGTTTLNNIASVDGPATDPGPDPNTDQESTPVTEDAEIVLTKTTTGDNPVRAGENATFSIEVSNTGSSDARNVSVSDVLPDGMSLVSISGSGWDCTALVCTIDRIVADTSAPLLTVVAKVAAGTPDGSNLVNRATATTTTPGDDPGNNSDPADVDVVAEADLSLVKSHATGDGTAGTPTQFTMVVTNQGPSDALAPLTITDTLPNQMSFLSAAAPWACSAVDLTVTCTLDQGLLAGLSAPTLTLQVQIAADAIGTARNTATVSSPTTDPNDQNDTDDAEVLISQTAEVSLTKTHLGTAHVGDPLTWELLVTNNGPSVASDVVVTDTLPTGLAFVSAEGTDWTCAEDTGVVTCELAGTLAPLTSAGVITVITDVLPEAYPSVENAAILETSTPDENPDNNVATDTVEVPPLVDLAITKSHQGKLTVGEQATYDLLVTNNGPTPDPGPITVTDTLPIGLKFVSATGDGFTCTNVAALVTCVRATPLGVDESATITLVVEVLPQAYPEVTNLATVGTEAEDTDPDNDQASDPGPVVPLVELGLDKSVVKVTTDQVIYKITVTNRGPNVTIKPVVIRDPLPDGLRLVSASGEGWSCTEAPKLAVCTYADSIPVDATKSIRLVADITAAPGTEIDNVASVRGGGTEEGVSDNAEVDVPDPSGTGNNNTGGLPNTGGPALWILVAGLVLILGGGGLLVRRR